MLKLDALRASFVIAALRSFPSAIALDSSEDQLQTAARLSTEPLQLQLDSEVLQWRLFFAATIVRCGS